MPTIPATSQDVLLRLLGRLAARRTSSVFRWIITVLVEVGVLSIIGSTIVGDSPAEVGGTVAIGGLGPGAFATLVLFKPNYQAWIADGTGSLVGTFS